MDGSRKPEVLSRTLQVKRTTGQIVLKVARLQLYPMIYSGKNKYESRYSIKERAGRHERRQQRRSTTKGRNVVKKNCGQNTGI